MYDRWLQNALKNMPKGRTQEGLADHLGLSQSVVSRMASGRRRIKADEIDKICRYLGLPAPSLSDKPLTVHGGAAIMVSGVMADRVWRERADFISDVKVPGVPDARYAGLPQYAMLMESPFEPHGRRGEYAIFVSWDEVRGDNPLRGDLIHVVRTRDGLKEHTLRAAEQTQDGLLLTSPATEPISWPQQGGEVELRGLFLTTYRPPR